MKFKAYFDRVLNENTKDTSEELQAAFDAKDKNALIKAFGDEFTKIAQEAKEYSNSTYTDRMKSIVYAVKEASGKIRPSIITVNDLESKLVNNPSFQFVPLVGYLRGKETPLSDFRSSIHEKGFLNKYLNEAATPTEYKKPEEPKGKIHHLTLTDPHGEKIDVDVIITDIRHFIYRTPSIGKTWSTPVHTDKLESSYWEGWKKILTDAGLLKGNSLVKEPTGEKKFYTMDDVGKRGNYTVNYHDGVSTHKDGSQFYGMKILKSKKERDNFVQELIKKGYKEGKSPLYENNDEPHGYKPINEALPKSMGDIDYTNESEVTRMIEDARRDINLYEKQIEGAKRSIQANKDFIKQVEEEFKYRKLHADRKAEGRA